MEDEKLSTIESTDEENTNKKEIEVITGDGENLDISPVYSHIKIDKPDVNRNKNRKIIIPKSKEENNNNSEENESK